MNLNITGQYRDSLFSSTGQGLQHLPWRKNVVVNRALDLIAGLLRDEEGLAGICYWALGTGDPLWDQAPVVPDRRSRALVNEVYRKRLDPDRDLAYDLDTHTLTVRVRFEPGEIGTDTLREFGLFGGDASARPDSGYLVNHAIHPALVMDPDEMLERELRLRLSAEAGLDSALDLIADLLQRQRSGPAVLPMFPGPSLPGRPILSLPGPPAVPVNQRAGIRYWAVGTGEEAWDLAAPAFDPATTQLAHEVFRKPVDTARDVEYDEDTRTIVVRAQFTFDEAAGVLREFGLFAGDATAAPGSGRLLSHQIHPAIDRTQPLQLKREYHFTLGAEVSVPVPDLLGLTQEAARATLLAAGLAVGTISLAESDAQAGLVVAQAPVAGELVAEGARVDISIAVPVPVLVPDVRGLMPTDASVVLGSAGLGLSASPPGALESMAAAGTIIFQDPAAGSRAPMGSDVQIIVARPRMVAVPELTGRAVPEATVLLRATGLNVAAEPHPSQASDLPYGTVVGQQPAAGELVAVGSTVTPIVAVRWSVVVPDLTGLTPDQAAAILGQAAAPLLAQLGRPDQPAGLALGALSIVEREGPAGTVGGQTPAPGQRAPLYGTVAVELLTPPTVQVPNLAGKTADQAGTALAAVGLTVGPIKQRPDVAPGGTVVEQKPQAGARVARGSAIGLVLAQAIQVRVPGLIGRMLGYAREVLLSRGLALGQAVQQISDLPVDSIVTQTPGEGTPVDLGTAVNVTIAARVPDVVGVGLGEAVQILQAIGLVPIMPPTEEVSDQATGTVLRQAPAGGEAALPGDSVSLVVAAGVPDLVGRSLDEGSSLLEAVGLHLIMPPTEVASDKPEGTILSQEPAAGQPAVIGDGVAVVIAVSEVVIRGILPAAARRGRTLAARLVGQNLHRATAVSFQRDGQDDPRVVGRITQVAPQELSLAVRIMGNAALGPRTIVVQTSAGPVSGSPDLTFTVQREVKTPLELVEPLDDFTLMVRPVQPMADLITVLANLAPYGLVSPRALEDLGDEIARQPIGTGPFIFREWAPGEAILLERNREYWRGVQTELQEVIFRFQPGLESLTDYSAVMMQLRAGEFDVLEVRNPAAVQMASQFGMRVVTAQRFYRDQNVFLIFPQLSGRFLSLGGLHLEGLVNPRSPDKLVYLCQDEPVTFDPLEMGDTASLRVASQVLEGLASFQPGGQAPGGRLAADWTSGTTGEEWRFFLRQEVFFHDQERFDAKAVFLNWRRFLP